MVWSLSISDLRQTDTQNLKPLEMEGCRQLTEQSKSLLAEAAAGRPHPSAQTMLLCEEDADSDKFENLSHV
jgi:hypothetical protein